MNTVPMLRGTPVPRGTCGRTAVENVARYFWQSRSGLLIDLTDLRDLARTIRRTWP